MSWATSRARKALVPSQSHWAWISDDLLKEAFDRFISISATYRISSVLQCKRHASNTPGLFEARRRLARRRMNNLAAHPSAGTGLAFDPFVFLQDLWGRPTQPYWSWEAPSSSKRRSWQLPPLPSWLLEPPPPPAPGPGLELTNQLLFGAETEESSQAEGDTRTLERLKSVENIKDMRLLLKEVDMERSEPDTKTVSDSAFSHLLSRALKGNVPSRVASTSLVSLGDLLSFLSHAQSNIDTGSSIASLCSQINELNPTQLEAQMLVRFLEDQLDLKRLSVSNIVAIIQDLPDVVRAAFKESSDTLEASRRVWSVISRVFLSESSCPQDFLERWSKLLETTQASQDLTMVGIESIVQFLSTLAGPGIIGRYQFSALLGRILDMTKTIDSDEYSGRILHTCSGMLRTIANRAVETNNAVVGHWTGPILSRVSAMPTSEDSLRVMSEAITLGYVTGAWFQDTNHSSENLLLISSCVRKMLDYELDRQETRKCSHPSAMLSSLLSHIVGEDYRHFLRNISEKLIDPFMHRLEAGDRQTCVLEKWISTVRSSEAWAKDRDFSRRTIRDSFGRLLTKHRPSEIVPVLRILRPHALCLTLLEHWTLPRFFSSRSGHCSSRQESSSNSKEEDEIFDKTISISEKDSLVRNMTSEINETIEELRAQPAISVGGWVNLDLTLYEDLEEDLELRKRPTYGDLSTNPSSGDSMLLGNEHSEAKPDLIRRKWHRLLHTTYPFIVLLNTLRNHAVPMNFIQDTLEELLQILHTLKRHHQFEATLRGAQDVVHLRPTKTLHNIIEAQIKEISHSHPHFALRLFNFETTFPLSRVPSLIQDVIASKRSNSHPKSIILTLLQDREQHKEDDTPLITDDGRTDKALTAIHASQIQDAALAFSRASRFSIRTAWTNIWRIWRYLRAHEARIDSRMSRAMVIAGILRPIHEGICWKIHPTRFRFILAVVRSLEGEDVADSIDRMVADAQKDESRRLREEARMERRKRYNSSGAEDSDSDETCTSWRQRMHQREKKSALFRRSSALKGDQAHVHLELPDNGFRYI